jgi:hypothetical protein
MIVPPFIVHPFNDSDAEFCCLAFAPVRYSQFKKSRFAAALGIYFSSHKNCTSFSLHSFAEDGHSLSYSRGDDSRDTLDFLLLRALAESSIHPAVWKLFPRGKVPPGFRSEEYEEARRDLCHLLYHFRSQELALKLTAGLPHEPLTVCDESAERIAFGDSEEEDDELAKARIKEG